MIQSNFIDGLLEFLQQSPTPFHAVTQLSARFARAGYTELHEGDAWQLRKGGKYFVQRNGSACIAFKTGTESLLEHGLRLSGTHTDSPCLKLKPNPVVRRHSYVQLGVEVYGGALLHPWFDRDLSMAGRVNYRNKAGQISSVLLDLCEPIAFIPSLAIHLDREVHEGRALNRQTELPPVILQLKEDGVFDFERFLLTQIQKQKGHETASQILSHELSLYDTQPPALVGLHKQFIAAARLDNLLSCYTAAIGLLDSSDAYTSVLVCNDHEEVGSASTSGAQGPFLRSVLERIITAECVDADAFARVIHRSVMLSIDNAHGVHPNYADKHDAQHQPLLNAGPIIKVNANQRYASNSESIAFFKSVCDRVGVSHQSFVMRSDLACGSTIGPLTASELGINTVDIGLATFGMHSIRELAGAEDGPALARVVSAFYQR
ncbi:MAG: M18 family aminopeptidase [Gammaproteobacteria bacterium]|nr:M18 family aminopeptidase [Gammaproteobacteria bacterium]